MLISPRMATPCPPLSSLPAPPLQHHPSPPPCEWDDHDRRTPNGNADKSDLPPKKFKPLPWHSKVAYLKRCLLLNNMVISTNLVLRLTPSINSFIERYVVTFCCWGIKYLRRLLFNSDNLDQPGVEVDSLLSETSNPEALRGCDQAEQLALGHAHLIEHTDGHKGIKNKFQLHTH